jgi:hypothetical protein
LPEGISFLHIGASLVDGESVVAGSSCEDADGVDENRDGRGREGVVADGDVSCVRIAESNERAVHEDARLRISKLVEGGWASGRVIGGSGIKTDFTLDLGKNGSVCRNKTNLFQGCKRTKPRTVSWDVMP